MRKTAFVFSLLLVVFFAQSNFAQNRPMNLDDRLQTLTKELNLNEQQAKEIKRILIEQREAMMELRQNFSGNRTGMRDEMKKIFDGTTEKILKVLNEEQGKKYKELIKNRFGQRRRRG